MMTRLLLCAMLAAAIPAQAHQRCQPTAKMLAHFAAQHRAAPVAMGIRHDGHLIQVLADEDGGWAIISSSPRTGMSCVLAVGERWEQMPSNAVRL